MLFKMVFPKHSEVMIYICWIGKKYLFPILTDVTVKSVYVFNEKEKLIDFVSLFFIKLVHL